MGGDLGHLSKLQPAICHTAGSARPPVVAMERRDH
jgi:hypothetical protein